MKFTMVIKKSHSKLLGINYRNREMPILSRVSFNTAKAISRYMTTHTINTPRYTGTDALSSKLSSTASPVENKHVLVVGSMVCPSQEKLLPEKVWFTSAPRAYLSGDSQLNALSTGGIFKDITPPIIDPMERRTEMMLMAKPS